MNSAPRDDITRWLRGWSNGDETAFETPLVYGELHQRARGLMGRKRAGHSLQPTVLIHEAYLRLVGSTSVEVGDILEVFPQTVLRNWRLAKAWLQRETKRGHRGRP
jgi:hypothetical protein